MYPAHSVCRTVRVRRIRHTPCAVRNRTAHGVCRIQIIDRPYRNQRGICNGQRRQPVVCDSRVPDRGAGWAAVRLRYGRDFRRDRFSPRSLRSHGQRARLGSGLCPAGLRDRRFAGRNHQRWLGAKEDAHSRRSLVLRLGDRHGGRDRLSHLCRVPHPLGGVGVGIASMASPMYIAEISPARIRGRMVSVNQFAIVSGMLIIYFVNYFIAAGGDPAWNSAMGWRWMFASGVVPSAIFLFALFSVAESPRWLVEHGRLDECRGVLTRVGARFADEEFGDQGYGCQRDPTTSSSPRSGDAVRSPPRCCVGDAAASRRNQRLPLLRAEIFKQLGFQVDAALMATVCVGVVNLTFTVLAIWTVDRLGRKPLMLSGAAGMGVCLFTAGAVFQLHVLAGWVVALILGYIACFALSVGPVTWVILSEIFPNSIRGRALSVATFTLWSANFVVSADVSDDERERLAYRELQPRLSFLRLRGVLRRAAGGCLAGRAGNQGPIAGGNRELLDPTRAVGYYSPLPQAGEGPGVRAEPRGHRHSERSNCHSERSEESPITSGEILRCAQDDFLLRMTL